MVVPLVTAIDRKYLPGLKALYRSYLANAGRGFEFYCIVDGDADLFAEVEALGIKTIDAPKWADKYPTSKEWPEQIPAMFADLQIPRLFPDHKHAIWIDADAIIADDMGELLTLDFDEPVAAASPPSENYTLGFVLRKCPAELWNIRAPLAGLVVFNVQEWNRRNLTEKCAEAMQDRSITFRYGDLSVLAYVLRGDFHRLPLSWQAFAHRKNVDMEGAKVLHWLGGLPWEEEMRNGEIWEHHASL